MADIERPNPPARVVGYDAWGGQSWCPGCATQRFQLMKLDPKDPNGEPITAITTADEFVDEMSCAGCKRSLTGDWRKSTTRPAVPRRE